MLEGHNSSPFHNVVLWLSGSSETHPPERALAPLNVLNDTFHGVEDPTDIRASRRHIAGSCAGLMSGIGDVVREALEATEDGDVTPDELAEFDKEYEAVRRTLHLLKREVERHTNRTAPAATGAQKGSS